MTWHDMTWHDMIKAYYHLIKGSNDNDNMALSCHVMSLGSLNLLNCDVSIYGEMIWSTHVTRSSMSIYRPRGFLAGRMWHSEGYGQGRFNGQGISFHIHFCGVFHAAKGKGSHEERSGTVSARSSSPRFPTSTCCQNKPEVEDFVRIPHVLLRLCRKSPLYERSRLNTSWTPGAEHR